MVPFHVRTEMMNRDPVVGSRLRNWLIFTDLLVYLYFTYICFLLFVVFVCCFFELLKDFQEVVGILCSTQKATVV